MQSIGERLEEARKRMGISLREASEATKIRSDFLKYIEQNQLDFELPEIYKRGFVKNYATYLKLDPQSILTDYTAQLLSSSNGVKNTGSELFGSMELNSNTGETNEPILGKISTKKQADGTNEDGHNGAEIDKVFYVKVGLVVLGVLTFLFIIIGLITAVLSSDGDQEIEVANPNKAPVSRTVTSNSVANAPTSTEETISLIASGTVYVLAKQRNDNKELVRKTLSEGETLEFKKQGPVDILFTAGENLVIVNPAGKRLKPNGVGTAKISIP